MQISNTLYPGLEPQHESMDPSCLVSTVQAGGVMVWEIFPWHTLGPLVPSEHCLNATAYLSIVADHVHPSMQGWTGHWDYREFPGGPMAQWASFSDSGPPPPPPLLCLSLPAELTSSPSPQRSPGGEQRIRGRTVGAGGMTEEHDGGDRQLTQQLWEFLTSA